MPMNDRIASAGSASFSLTEDQLALQAAARTYARERLPALAERLESDGEPPSRELMREFAAHGFLGVNIRESLGGLGLGNLEALIVLEEFGKISTAVAMPVFESSVGPVRAVDLFAAAELKNRVVPRVCRGEMMVSVAIRVLVSMPQMSNVPTRSIADAPRMGCT